MHYLIVAILIALAVLILSLCSCDRKPATPAVGQSQLTEQPVGQPQPPGQSQLRRELAKRLKLLAQSNVPDNPPPNAMCYKPAPEPTVANYTCPVCSEKTVYALQDDKPESRNTVNILHHQLDTMRRLMQDIKNMEKRPEIKLDESQFCQKCRPNVKAPLFAITVKYPGEEQEHRVEPVTADDLDLLAEFLAGELEHTADFDAKSPLKLYIDRLEKLLHVKAEK